MPASTRGGASSRPHPIARLLTHRLVAGVVVLFLVSILIFWATQALPGNAATAILGHSATPKQVESLERQLHLDRPRLVQYFSWLGGILSGDPGTSLANGASVGSIVGPALLNTVALLVVAGLVGTVTAVLLGLVSAAWHGSVFDRALSVVSLALISLPEFVVAIGLVLLLSTNVFQIFPAVSIPDPGKYVWQTPSAFVLPALTLTIIVIPYILRMTRGATVEALSSDYAEFATLKGLTRSRILFGHALPNAVPPIVQVIGLTLLYLAGGVVIVEYVFAYPGVGNALVSAVGNRDVPVIQFIVLVLALFYVVVNILSDLVALLATPRRRLAR